MGVVFLADLDRRDYDVVLLDTDSIKLKMYIQDKLKNKFRCTSDTMIQVSSKKDISRVKEIMGVSPPFSDYWFVVVDVSKVGIKDIESVLISSNTCVFLCIVDKYKDFKTLKTTLTSKVVLDYYVSYLRKRDIVYLYDAFIPKEKRLEASLFNFFMHSYSSDIDEVFDLLLALNSGKKVKSRSDIIEICGLGGLTVEGYLITLLKTKKYTSRIFKNRLQAGVELANIYKYSTLYTYMRNALQSFIQIKELRITGGIYKSVRNLPAGYDEKKLSRYNRYVSVLNEIPMSRLLIVWSNLGGRWRGSADFLNFLMKVVV